MKVTTDCTCPWKGLGRRLHSHCRCERWDEAWCRGKRRQLFGQASVGRSEGLEIPVLRTVAMEGPTKYRSSKLALVATTRVECTANVMDSSNKRRRSSRKRRVRTTQGYSFDQSEKNKAGKETGEFPLSHALKKGKTKTKFTSHLTYLDGLIELGPCRNIGS